jgi:hypothetical protein
MRRISSRGVLLGSVNTMHASLNITTQYIPVCLFSFSFLFVFVSTAPRPRSRAWSHCHLGGAISGVLGARKGGRLVFDTFVVARWGAVIYAAAHFALFCVGVSAAGQGRSLALCFRMLGGMTGMSGERCGAVCWTWRMKQRVAALLRARRTIQAYVRRPECSVSAVCTSQSKFQACFDFTLFVALVVLLDDGTRRAREHLPHPPQRLPFVYMHELQPHTSTWTILG